MPEAGPRRPRHILIYGPPAAGKLTVAQALAARYGLCVLDNHVAIDPALRLFRFGTKELPDLVEKLRADLFVAAASASIDVVSTLVFVHPHDRPRIARLFDATEAAGAHTAYVQLLPSRGVLEQRVVNESRSGTEKIRDVALLARMLDQLDLATPIHDSDLMIDNGELTPTDVARRIGRELGLDR